MTDLPEHSHGQIRFRGWTKDCPLCPHPDLQHLTDNIVMEVRDGIGYCPMCLQPLDACSEKIGETVRYALRPEDRLLALHGGPIDPINTGVLILNRVYSYSPCGHSKTIHSDSEATVQHA